MTITALTGISQEIEQNQATAQQSLSRVLAAIKAASDKTGVDFAYLVNKAAQESGFRTEVKAKTSSATGLYQFTEQTWLQMVRDNGSQYGIGDLAGKIETRQDGSLAVRDRATRHHILALRKNPELAAAMAAEFASDNKEYLTDRVGGTIGRTELYMAHFLGAGGAAEFLEAKASNPQVKAASLLPEAAAANRSVFYDEKGKARTVSQIYDRFAVKMEGKGIDLPDTIPAQPQLLAAVGHNLAAVPDLKLPASAFTLPSDVPQSTMTGTTAGALFSTMVLAQLDLLPGMQSHGFTAFDTEKDDRQDRVG